MKSFELEYLNFLNLKPEQPSFHFLEKICSSQLNTFPFENISKLIYYHKGDFNVFKVPPMEIFLHNYKEYNFGGTCYTLNFNLYMLLKQLGFSCYLTILGNQHMAIIVDLYDDKYYVDCGAAAPFFQPLLLQKENNKITNFGNDRIHILSKNEKAYDYVRITDGKQSGETWKFNPAVSNELADFNSVIDKSNTPGSTFMLILRCQMYQLKKNRSISLVNNKFGIRYVNGSTKITTLNSPEEIIEVITEEFMLPKLPILEAINVLKGFNIDIFSQNNE
ncbi:arylamine N-acetyltransferase [Bacillus sp. Bva_UNVM-123]|uniref:arylamine N-acetyltransferase n=1 Tax=Bacillus sp. Bva_UNVM-123 TaxID=2829798 RepID=UPI00391F2E9B